MAGISPLVERRHEVLDLKVLDIGPALELVAEWAFKALLSTLEEAKNPEIRFHNIEPKVAQTSSNLIPR